MSELSAAFVAALSPGLRPPPGNLEEQLRALFEAGRSAWPGVQLAPTIFARHLGGHAAGEAALPPAALAADIYLACACAAGVPAAVAAFDRSFSQAIERAVTRVGAEPAFVADARQVVLEHLLVPPPGVSPRIAEYAGRAPLRVWLRAVAVRAALNLRRRKAEQPHEPVEREGAELPGGIDLELGYLKARYKVEFEAAVRASIQQLSSDERTLLRLNLVDGMSIDALAERYGIGRSTAARRLASARETLRERTRLELETRFGLTHSSMDKLAALVRSQLDVSASSLLAEGGE